MKFKELTESSHKCPHCGGPMFSEMMMTEKKDACYYKVKAGAKVWPSAYASGRLVQCRKKGAANYGNKSEGVMEMDKSQTPPGRDGSNDEGGKKEYPAKIITPKKAVKDGEKILNKAFKDSQRVDPRTGKKMNTKGVAESGENRYRFIRHNIWTAMDSDEEVLQHTVEGDPFYSAKKFMRDLDDQGYDFTHVISPEGKITYAPQHDPRHLKNFPEQGVAEGFNSEYDDEAGMADNNLETLDRAVEGIDRLIQSGDNLPEWCQEKIAVAKSMLVSVWDYMYSEEASDEVDPEIDAMFEAMDQLAEEMAVKNGVTADLVWEQFEAMDDRVLYETAAWRRKEGKSKKGGLNAKGVASYRRENPGSKLQMAVTTKPSKLKPGSKAAKRRKSFCARMSGVKGPMKKPNGKPTRKALALRKWNC